MKQLYAQVIADVRDGKAGTIHPELYRAYCENLRKAVSGYADDDLKAQFEANLSRFAAYKAWHATRQLERQLADPDGVQRTPEQFDRMARAVLNTFNRYQAAEYNTAVARARTAHQWQQFSQADNAMLFPNLRWLPSRSANPREEHKPFYNLVLPKNHTFWTHNQPGSLWNCKCDWEETDDPIDLRKLTPDQLADFSTAQGAIHARGLEGNPAETGQIFTDECTYIKKAPTTEEFTQQINITGRNYARKSDFTKYTMQSDIGEIHVNKDSFKESVKANTDAETKSYYLKNEIIRHLDIYMGGFQRDPIPETIDLSHNIPGSEAYEFKDKCRCMHVFRGNIHGLPIILKVAELKKNGKLILYSCHL